MVDADVATQAELDVVSGVASAAAAAAALKLSGDMVQAVHTQTSAVATGSTVIPQDDTIPQITEGNEYLTVAITPTNAANTLLITVTLFCCSDAANTTIVALFQDATANALAAVQQSHHSSAAAVITFTHKMAAGTTSATTFRVRAGMGGAGTLTVNGQGGVRRFGGVAASSITIREIKA